MAGPKTGRGRKSFEARALCGALATARVSSYSRPPTNTERQAYEDLIRRLTARRNGLGWSQELLDEKLGVAEGSTAKWESFARLPGAFMMACWCLALGVTLVPVGD